MVCVLFFDVVPKTENGKDENEADDEKDGGADKGIVKMTKAERRTKLKKSKKEAKKQGKDLSKPEEAEQAPQAAVLVLFLLDCLFCVLVCYWQPYFVLPGIEPNQKCLT